MTLDIFIWVDYYFQKLYSVPLYTLRIGQDILESIYQYIDMVDIKVYIYIYLTCYQDNRRKSNEME